MLVVRFKDDDTGKTYFKNVSAHIVRKKEDGTYIALTSRLNLLTKAGGKTIEAKDGVFFLQRVNDKYLAKFMFDGSEVEHYSEDFE